MGGDNGQGNYSNDVQLAVVQDDGKIGKFDKDNEQFVNPRWGHGAFSIEIAYISLEVQ
jgi:hypothetical protein